MLGSAVTFFAIALIAAVLGLGGFAGASADVGWMVAVIAAILAVIAMVRGVARGRGEPPAGGR